MRQLLTLCFLLAFASAKDEDASDIPINPAALSGILIVLMLLVFLYMGLNALSSINGPTVYSSVPLMVGKEK